MLPRVPDVAPLLAVLAVALVLVLGAAGLLVRSLTARPAHRGAESPADAAQDRPCPAVVINPTKFDDLGKVRSLIARVCVEHGWAEPLWLETTVSDSGFGQTREAVDAGADVVLACGGDGTMRFVAQALAGTGVAMGLLAAGTGNLLARNLDMERHDLAAATRIALTGDDRAVDVGRVRVDDALEEETFLVMAGMGFDAAIMAGAPAELKARVGPFAYVMAGLRSLRGRRVRISLGIDDAPVLQRRIRTVVVGNCGKLLGGLVLMPDAEVDDGTLDVVVIAPKGIVGWAAVTARVVTRRRKGHPRIEHWQAQRVTITAEAAQQAQFDGDPVGDARVLSMRVDPGALLVRVPAGRGTVAP